MLLFETYGGWSEPVVRLFRRMQDKVRNKLTKRQYENEVSWSTSTWLALQAQRLSVAVHIAFDIEPCFPEAKPRPRARRK